MLGRQFPTLETMLGDSAEELLAFTAFPPSHWTKIWPTTRWSGSTRRSNAARRRGVFPNPDALGRLAGAVLVEPTTKARSATAATSPKAPWPAHRDDQGGGASQLMPA
jgi:transposase-like protein